MPRHLSTGRIVAAVVAIVLAAALLFAWICAVWLVKPLPLHDGAATVPSVRAGTPPDRDAGSVEESARLARALTVGGNLPGLSAAVAVNGEIVWAEAFGWSDAESRTPLTPLTQFRLGAASKPLTATAAAVLYEQGRLDLDAPVQRYVPTYPAKQWTVTTRQLMGDVAGVHRIRGDNNDAMPTAHCEDVDEAVALLRDDPLLFEPGTQYRYSIWGWVLASAAIQGAAGERFDRVMVERVFEPLGMTRTLAGDRPDLDDGPSRHATPNALFGIRLGPKAADHPDYSCVAGGGAFLSTPSDLVRLGSAMVKPGLLEADTIRAFQTPGRLVSGAATTYALGWTVSTVDLAGRPARLVSHRGSPQGSSVSLLTYPDRGLAIAAAANVTNAAGVQRFAQQVADVFARDQNRSAR